VDVEERKLRTQKYINLSEKKLRSFYEKNLGSFQTVLFEEQSKKDRMVGFTENYIKVEINFNPDLVNELRKVTLKSILPNGNVAVEFPG
jgi:threonylcarbamoyladenosine tRNA methylthiotransferase MtaB